MFQTYDEIFAERADAYHAAMARWPHARDREFELALEGLDLTPGNVLCDAPAGGGYLRRYLPADLKYVAVETAPDFISHCPTGPHDRTVLSPLEAIDLPDASVDTCVSLAGVHHLPDKSAFYREAARILKPGGTFMLVDAATGSTTGDFLNIFVDQHSSMGHEGDFLGAATRRALTDCGFEILSDASIAYPWRFASDEDMGQFCQLLFGIDRAERQDIVDGIDTHLGRMDGPGLVNLRWELTFLRCIRTEEEPAQ